MSAEGPNVQRRLAAVLAADVVGYSRLMEVDEAGTLARLKTVRLELIDPAIAKCKGRIVKTTGDGLLVEFQSVTEALRCAVDFQERMARRNRDMPASRASALPHRHQSRRRHRRGRRYLRRRRQRRRAAGSAGGAGRHLHFRSGARSGRRPAAVGFEDLGEQHVKNISRPIRVYKSCSNGRTPDAATASPARRRAPRPARKPSIAVLPFVNMSGDPEQEFFADGLTEDIITELSRFRELLVISRNAVFVHKGKPIKAQQVAHEFGVRLRRRGQRAQGRRSRPRHGPADRRRNRDAPLGRALRSRARGHFRHPGRGHLGDRRDAVRPRRSRAARPRQAQAAPRTWRRTNAC